jgi:hypothetical protein
MPQCGYPLLLGEIAQCVAWPREFCSQRSLMAQLVTVYKTWRLDQLETRISSLASRISGVRFTFRERRKSLLILIHEDEFLHSLFCGLSAVPVPAQHMRGID